MFLLVFQRLPLLLQLAYVLQHGTYLAQRWDGMRGINLYFCKDDSRGFFIEVSFDAGWQQAVVLRSFVSSEPLERYTQRVRLPEE